MADLLFKLVPVSHPTAILCNVKLQRINVNTTYLHVNM